MSESSDLEKRVELKPCPFCGGPAKEIDDDSYGSCHVGCNECDVWWGGITDEGLSGPRDMWNRRALLAPREEEPGMREALEKIALKGCGIIHGGYPKGTTCLDIQKKAKEQRGRWTLPYGDEVRNGEHLCNGCRAKQALAARPVEVQLETESVSNRMQTIMSSNGHPDEAPCVVCGAVFDTHEPGCVFDVEAHAEAGEPAALSQTDYDNLVRDAMKWRSNDEERAWLIERRQDVSGEPPRYWAGGDFLGWTTDINDAIRFARREDALRVHDRHKGPILGYCNVVEHLWIDERHKEYSQKEVEIFPTYPASAGTEGPGLREALVEHLSAVISDPSISEERVADEIMALFADRPVEGEKQ